MFILSNLMKNQVVEQVSDSRIMIIFSENINKLTIIILTITWRIQSTIRWLERFFRSKTMKHLAFQNKKLPNSNNNLYQILFLFHLVLLLNLTFLSWQRVSRTVIYRIRLIHMKYNHRKAKYFNSVSSRNSNNLRYILLQKK